MSSTISPRPSALLLLVLAVEACGSTESPGRPAEPAPDAGQGDGAFPPEERDISLTLWPFYDVGVLLAATETDLPASLGGVLVCVKSARPHVTSDEGRGGTWWEPFDEIGEPCTTTVVDEPIMLEGVPPQSELIVTATKEGYWPSVLAVVTGAWSTDVVSETSPDTGQRLLAKGSPWPGIDPPPAENLGLLSIASEGEALLFIASLGGAAVTLEPGPSRGPYYGDGRTFDPMLERTLPATWPDEANSPELEWRDARPRPLVLFTDIAEGEHLVQLDHPRAHCGFNGASTGTPVFGFPAALDQIRVPVLAGHFTTNIVADCECQVPDLLSLDPATCEPASATDGGLP